MSRPGEALEIDLRAKDEITELVHRYADAVTTRDVHRWTACWADDAIWTLRPGRPAIGRDDIVALLLSALSTLDGVVQNVLNGEVHVEGEQASGRWHIQEHLRRVTGEAVLFLAHYDDTYTRRAGRWYFASRTLVTHYQGPPDLSGAFTASRDRDSDKNNDERGDNNTHDNNDSSKEGRTS